MYVCAIGTASISLTVSIHCSLLLKKYHKTCTDRASETSTGIVYIGILLMVLLDILVFF